MSHFCPSCRRVLYNRRAAHCGFCGAPIPENLRFTPEEIAALDQLMEWLEAQRSQREHTGAREEQPMRRNAGDQGGYLPGFM